GAYALGSSYSQQPVASDPFVRIEPIEVTLGGSGVRQTQAVAQMEIRIAECMDDGGWRYRPEQASLLFQPGVSYLDNPEAAAAIAAEVGYEIASDVAYPEYGAPAADAEPLNAAYESTLHPKEAEMYFAKLEDCRMEVVIPFERDKNALRGAYKAEVLDILWS